MTNVIAFVCICVVFLGLSINFVWRRFVWMPGRSFRGALPQLDEQQVVVRNVLEQDLSTLAHQIGERNVSHKYPQLIESAEFIERSLREAGHETRRQRFRVGDKLVWNVDIECTGRLHPEEVLVVGAHYDTVPGSPGANDNGSAVVVNLALARAFAHVAPARTVRFVFFVNEEWPYYMTDSMGSLRYAQMCKANGDQITGMIALETIGCFSDKPGSQRYPAAILRCLYPSTGNFIAIVGNVQSRRFVHRVVRAFRKSEFPSEGIAAPSFLRDIFRSDHAAFWHCGYPALMVTDTANFRYRYYHTPDDTLDKVNYDALARLVTHLRDSLLELAD